MDKIAKALARLTKKERTSVGSVLRKLYQSDLVGLDIKKLAGRSDIFRVRHGKIRVIYRTDAAGSIFILTIERRSERTYKYY